MASITDLKIAMRNYGIRKVNINGVQNVNNEILINEIKIYIDKDKEVFIKASFEEDINYELYLYPSAFTDLYSSVNDSAHLFFNIIPMNKYGNIIMGSFEGKLKLNVSHGDINARNLAQLKSIKLKYGKLKAKSVKKGDIYARFAKIRIDEVENIDLDCASSEVEIEKANRIVIKSLSDEIEVEKANSIQINSSFSDIEIEELNTSIKGNVKHGSLDVDLVHHSFNEISLNGQNTDIELNFTPNSSFEYFVQLEKGESFIVPSNGNNLKADNSFDNIHQYEGTFSRETLSENLPKIRIIAKHSFVQFDIN